MLTERFLSCSDTGNETYPALRCERVHNFHDLGVHWRMPEKASMKQTEMLLWENGVLENSFGIETILTPSLAEQRPDIKAAFKKAHEYAGIFKYLNPQLNKIQIEPDNWHQLRGFLHGSVSGFNVNDIQGWVSHTLDYSLYDDLRGRLMSLEGQSEFGWAPCPDTVQKIHKQLDDRYGNNITPRPFKL